MPGSHLAAMQPPPPALAAACSTLACSSRGSLIWSADRLPPPLRAVPPFSGAMDCAQSKVLRCSHLWHSLPCSPRPRGSSGGCHPAAGPAGRRRRSMAPPLPRHRRSPAASPQFRSYSHPPTCPSHCCRLPPPAAAALTGGSCRPTCCAASLLRCSPRPTARRRCWTCFSSTPACS